MLHLLALIGIVLLTIVAFPVMFPALVIAWLTPLTLWPTAAVILAVLVLLSAIRR